MRGSIRNKIFLGILCVVLVIVVLIIMIYYRNDARMIRTDYSENLYYRVEQMGKLFDDSMKDIYEISAELVYDPEFAASVRDFRAAGSDESIDRLVTQLREYKSQNRDISSVYVYFRDTQALITSEDYPAYIEDIALAIGPNSGRKPMFMQDPIRSGDYILSFWHLPEQTTAGDIAVLVNVNERNVYYNYIDNLNNAKVLSVVLLDQDGLIASAQDRGQLGGEYEQRFFDRVGKGGIVQEQDKTGIYYRASFSEYSIVVLVSAHEILEKLISLRWFILGISISCLIVAFVMSFFSAKVIFAPIKRLTETVKEVGNGDLSRRVTVTGNDEIGILAENFNIMLDHINGLFGQLVAEEKKKRDAELDALQYQITPHFMYNTLNSIKLFSQMRGEQEIAELIGCFVELLQAVINKRGVFITVSDEIGILNNYVKLQQFRKGDAFTVSYHIEPEAGDCYIPRLLLQPFVENSIMHGFNMREEGNEIDVRAVVRAEKLQISIADNGVGMTKAHIEALMQSETRRISGMSSIGIANVRERLELYFGASANIVLTGGKKGVTVAISVPALNDIEKVRDL